MGEMTVTYIFFWQIFTIFLRFLKPFLQLLFMISALGQNDRYNHYISAFLEQLLHVTAKLIEMVQYPPSQQEREKDNPHKILKMGSLHWVMIPCNEIQKLRLVTELYMQKWSDNLFTQ